MRASEANITPTEPTFFSDCTAWKSHIHSSHCMATSRSFWEVIAEKKVDGESFLTWSSKKIQWFFWEMSVSCQTRLVIWSRLTKSSYQHLQKAAVINHPGAIFFWLFFQKGTTAFHKQDTHYGWTNLVWWFEMIHINFSVTGAWNWISELRVFSMQFASNIQTH